MALTQQSHRMELEKTVISRDGRNETLGMVFAFILGLVTIGGAVFLLYNSKSITGMLTLLTGIGSLAGAFRYGKKHQVEELKNKDRDLIENKPNDEDD